MHRMEQKCFFLEEEWLPKMSFYSELYLIDIEIYSLDNLLVL